MTLGKLLLGVVLAGGTVVAGTATLNNAGAAQPEEALSLRQESARSQGRGFFYGYHRSHRGGGLAGGK